MHNPRDAERYLVEAVSLRDDGVTNFQMGKFLSRENRYHDAIKYYSKALRSNKEENHIYTRCNCLCYYEYGFALYKLENLHFAKEMYREALRIDKKINNSVSRFAPKKTSKLCKQIEKILNENEENTDNSNANFNFNINSNNIEKFKSSKNSQGNKNVILDCEESESVIDFFLFNEIDNMSNIGVDIDSDGDLFDYNGTGNDIEIKTKNNFGAYFKSNCNNLIDSNVENSFEMICQDIEKNYCQKEMQVDNWIKKNIQENKNNDNSKNNYNHVDKNCQNNIRLHGKNKSRRYKKKTVLTTEANKMQNKNKNKNTNEHKNPKKHQVLKDSKPKQFQCVEEQEQKQEQGKENNGKKNAKQSENDSDSGSNDHKSNGNSDSNSNGSNNNAETKRAEEFLIFWQYLPYFEPTKSKYFSQFVLNEWNCISMVNLITYDVLINDINMDPIHARIFQDGQSRVFDEKQTFLQWLNSFEFACEYQYIFERLGVYSFESFYRRFTNIDNFIDKLTLPSNFDVVHYDCHEMWQKTPQYKRLQRIKKTKSN